MISGEIGSLEVVKEESGNVGVESEEMGRGVEVKEEEGGWGGGERGRGGGDGGWGGGGVREGGVEEVNEGQRGGGAGAVRGQGWVWDGLRVGDVRYELWIYTQVRDHLPVE